LYGWTARTRAKHPFGRRHLPAGTESRRQLMPGAIKTGRVQTGNRTMISQMIIRIRDGTIGKTTTTGSRNMTRKMTSRRVARTMIGREVRIGQVLIRAKRISGARRMLWACPKQHQKVGFRQWV
jgi:hypothetical protein